MTKQRTKKATQQRVTTGTFLKVARFIGVSRERESSCHPIRVCVAIKAIITFITPSIAFESQLECNVPARVVAESARPP